MEFHKFTDTSSFFEFIRLHLNDDPSVLRLKYRNKTTGFDPEFAILQIECRKRFKKKLKGVLSSSRFVFPTALSGEQASNETVASFHASLIDGNLSGADLTTGLGIDTLAIAGKAKSVMAFEIDPLKADILSHNSKELGRDNITVFTGDSIKWLKENPDEYFDFVFIDPARRGDGNERLFNLHDCSPDIISNQDLILNKTKVIFVKASPMLDISQTLRDFPSLCAVRCISVDGECKEVLLELRNDCPLISFDAINLHSGGGMISQFHYTSEENGNEIQWADDNDLKEDSFLYEPDASIMKLAPWNIISQRFNSIKKLGPSSHLFISNQLYKDFPGRILQLCRVLTKKDLKQLKGERINVSTRNYPLSADILRKKLSLREGIDTFIYGTRLGETPVLLLAERLNPQ